MECEEIDVGVWGAVFQPRPTREAWRKGVEDVSMYERQNMVLELCLETHDAFGVF
jgi:hypothetical protein